MNSAEFADHLDQFDSLPAIPTITATDMFHAEGLTEAARREILDILRQRAEWVRKLTGDTGPVAFQVPVRDHAGILIGYMTYNV